MHVWKGCFWLSFHVLYSVVYHCSSWSAVKIFSSPYFVWPFWIAPVFQMWVFPWLRRMLLSDFYRLICIVPAFRCPCIALVQKLALFAYSGSDLVTLLPLAFPVYSTTVPPLTATHTYTQTHRQESTHTNEKVVLSWVSHGCPSWALSFKLTSREVSEAAVSRQRVHSCLATLCI